MTVPSLDDTDTLIKLFYVGDSGTGKTGSLISLIEAGYNLRVLDYDNGTEILRQLIKHRCPERIGQLDVEKIVDPYQNTPSGPKIKGSPKAFIRSVELLDKWSDGTTPAEWGRNTVLVLDSLSHYSRAAFAFVVAANPSYKDGRLHVRNAQETIMNQLSTLMQGEYFQAHVIITCHAALIDLPDGTKKAFPYTVGKALGPRLPSICNTVIQARSIGMGKEVRRTIHTLPSAILDLKNPSPFKIEATYPLESGMASIFATLRGSETPNARP